MIISKTPLRCSFFGGGTDFSDYYENSSLGVGKTISTTLDMNVYITVNRSFDGSIRLCYSENERVSTVDEVKHNIIREALRKTGIEGGIEIIYSADIPLSSAGIGLASSSALAVGVLNALYAYRGIYKTPAELAADACDIEINRLGQQIGIQDQYAVAFGGFRVYTYTTGDAVASHPVCCSNDARVELADNLMLFFTGKTRDSRKILNEQTATISQKMAMLDRLVMMVDEAESALRSGDVRSWGKLLDRAWAEKKTFAQGVSNEVIDGMYEAACASGALGGKVLGAGGGGFLLLFVPPDCQATVRRSLAGYREVPFKFNSQGTQIVFAD